MRILIMGLPFLACVFIIVLVIYTLILAVKALKIYISKNS